MWRYGKGSRAERELLNKFKQHGFIVVRAAGSGFEGPDIIAIKGGKEYAIECKAQWERAVRKSCEMAGEFINAGLCCMEKIPFRLVFHPPFCFREEKSKLWNKV
jgi:hypothetical protein